jgi:hypothetical protein
VINPMYWSATEASLEIKEIDGAVAGGVGPYCVSPGKHTLGVAVWRSNKEAREYAELAFSAKGTYTLRAYDRGESFEVVFSDASAQPPRVISQFNIKGQSIKPATVTPVIIPSGH